MAKRKIISIDENLCNGCGDCISACAEGALAIINGKAKVVRENFCDGFGDCIKGCPTGALRIVEREAAEFDLEATRRHVRELGGEAAVQRLEAANAVHAAAEKRLHVMNAHGSRAGHGGCPGSMMRSFEDRKSEVTAPSGSGQVMRSELAHWPVQIHLVRPDAPFFEGKELVVMATCGPVACPDVHWRFMRGRAVVIGCPKLDRTEGYAEKLGAIFRSSGTPKVIIVRMEVPCCGGLTSIVEEGVRLSGRSDVRCEEVTVSLGGDVLATRELDFA